MKKKTSPISVVSVLAFLCACNAVNAQDKTSPASFNVTPVTSDGEKKVTRGKEVTLEQLLGTSENPADFSEPTVLMFITETDESVLRIAKLINLVAGDHEKTARAAVVYLRKPAADDAPADDAPADDAPADDAPADDAPADDAPAATDAASEADAAIIKELTPFVTELKKIKIAIYSGQGPEGYEIVRDNPATVVIWKDKKIERTFPLSAEVLQKRAAEKNILAAFIGVL